MKVSPFRASIGRLCLIALVGLTVAALSGCKSAAPNSSVIEAAKSGDTKIISNRLAAGDDINSHDSDGYTPLHWATYMGQLNAIKFLVEHGANLEAVDKDGLTPLIVAVSCDNRDATLLLLEKGANVNARDPKGWTSVDYANSNRSKYGIYNLDPAMLELLITYIQRTPAAHINDKGITGYTPLHWAAYTGNFEAAKTLIDRGANVESVNNDGSTPLIMAAYSANPQITLLLVEKGANLNAHDNNGWTALEFAAYNGDLPTAKALVEHGADVNLTIKGLTPLKVARKYKSKPIEDLLKQHGATQ